MNKMKLPGSDKLMNRFFRRVDNVVWDLMSGKIGVQTAEGIASLEGEGDDAQININFFEEMAVAIPAFAQSTPKDGVKVGDMIYTTGDTPGWVISKSEKGAFRIMRANGTIQSWNPPKVQMFGLDGGVMVVRSLTAMLPGGSTDLGAMQGMLLPMLMGGGLGDGDLEDIMPMMLMMQTMNGAGGAANMAPMMQMLMMKKMFSKDDDNHSYGGRAKTPFRT